MMKIVEKFLHFFTPRHTNNHRAKALHLTSLSTYMVLLLVFQIFLTGVARFSPGILGYASNITVSDLVRYTNEKRAQSGAQPLVLNDQLSAAAAAKAQDMFAAQYWAHTSPSGKDPWSFIASAGYGYLFAGENLARDFGDSAGVVSAWMNSLSHRENLLNSKYKDVGFAVVNGKYGGYETTLVVQMFGTKPSGTPTVNEEVAEPVAAQETVPAPAPPAPVEETKPVLATPSGMVLNTDSLSKPPKFDIFTVTKYTSLAMTVGLLGILALDGILAYRRKVVRLSGHNFAHLVLLMALLAALNLVGRGIIL